MSTVLNQGTIPHGLEIKTHRLPIEGRNVVFLGSYEISLVDFLTAAEYVLTNTDLKTDDPRLQFIKRVRSMEQVNGYNENGKRLKASKLAALPSRA